MLLCVRLPQQPFDPLVRRLEQVSSPWRLQKAARLTGRVRLRSLAAGALLELALARAGVPGGGCCDEAGAPCPARGAPPYVSLSHSGDYAVCALADRPVGVDVQTSITRRHPRLALRVCAEAERAALQACADSTALFTALWALKEAYIKITRPADPVGALRAAAFSLPDGWERAECWVEADGPLGCVHRLHRLPDGVMLALCHAGEGAL